MRARALIALALCSMEIACASHPNDVLVPVHTQAANANIVNLLVVSTRAPSAQPGEVYSGERGGLDFSMRTVSVSVPPTHRIGYVEWPSAPPGDVSRNFVTTDVETVDRAGARAWFDARNAHGHVLIFVHGFNTPFSGAVYRLAQLVYDAAPGAAPVLFTWPSRGQLADYLYDRESANYSRDALEATLHIAAQNPNVTEITVFAHSMGAWITMEALRQYAIREGRLDAKIHAVILAAPDLDVDVFKQQFLTLGPERPRFILLVARDDHALQISRLLAGGLARVGGVDIGQEPYRSELERTPGVSVLDLTSFHSRDHTNHLLYAESPAVLSVLRGEFSELKEDH